MAKGGYTIIDFKGSTLKLDGEDVLIKGIYAQCEKALRTNKMIICENITLNNDDDTTSSINDFSVVNGVENYGGFTLYTLFSGVKCAILISNNDKVAFQNID